MPSMKIKPNLGNQRAHSSTALAIVLLRDLAQINYITECYSHFTLKLSTFSQSKVLLKFIQRQFKLYLSCKYK